MRAPGTTESVSYVVDIPASSARCLRQASVSMLAWEARVPDAQKLPGHGWKRQIWARATAGMVPRDGIVVSLQQQGCMYVAHAFFMILSEYFRQILYIYISFQ